MQKHKASNNARTTPFLRIVTVTIVVLGIGYFLILEPYLDNRDKQKFLDAQAFIEETYQEKILPIAEPDEVTRVESCRYSGAKYAKGNLSCQVSLSITYKEPEYKESAELVNTVSTSFGESLRSYPSGVELSVDKIMDYGKDESYEVYQPIEYTKASCSISYTYSLAPKNQNDELRISLGCSDDARAEHFAIE